MQSRRAGGSFGLANTFVDAPYECLVAITDFDHGDNVSEVTRPLRSLLYMPASNAKAIAKSRTLDCDAVIFDLEDAVAPNEKDAARVRAVEAVQAGDFGNRTVVVRVNGLSTPWGEADFRAVAECAPDAILVPKVSSAAEVRACHELMSAFPANTQLWIMIETARSIFNLAEIADVASETRLAAFVLGTNDLCKETNARLVPGRAAVMPLIALAVTAGKMANLAVIDGVYNSIEDTAGFEAECHQGLEYGCDGKTLIHPGQIAIANRAFSPTEAEVTFAKAVIEAFSLPENADAGALRVDGKMVELLHLEQCKRLCAIDDVIRADRSPAVPAESAA
ncbi:HpcH/HpaI aldolase/citrate lyase family protein [Novosphingobium colocasiae]|uniref:HpcH/HpaI aldolase/citrate lyase family protein n=1 Tax=Novosphingobium colocasiae TaxID=1256513 RepID=UPI00167ABC5B|nr:CoA ester lyase [Novosphingobium colocasiae]